MKKLVVLSTLILISSVQADVMDSVNKRVDKAGAAAGDYIETRINKKMKEEVSDPLEKINKNLEAEKKRQQKLLEKNAEDAVKRAALALWAKIKGLFSRN